MRKAVRVCCLLPYSPNFRSPPTVSEKKKNVSFHPLAAEIIAEKLAKDEGEFDASTVENQVTPAAEIKTELRQGYDMEEY